MAGILLNAENQVSISHGQAVKTEVRYELGSQPAIVEISAADRSKLEEAVNDYVKAASSQGTVLTYVRPGSGTYSAIANALSRNDLLLTRPGLFDIKRWAGYQKIVTSSQSPAPVN